MALATLSDKFMRKVVELRREKAILEEERKPSFPLNKLENVICEVQRILIWDEPDYSINCILLVNLVFCLLVFMDFRVYGVIFFIWLCFSLEDMCEDYIAFFIEKQGIDPDPPSPRAVVNTDIFADISGYLKTSHAAVKNACDKAKLLRKTEPGLFCMMACLCFVWLNVVGQTVSDVFTFYILVMVVMTVPGLFVHFFPKNAVCNFSNTIRSSRGGGEENDDEVEPYLPENTPENLELLHLAGDVHLSKNDEDEESNDLLLERLSARTTDTTESMCSKLSFYPESSLMPSPEASMDFLELDLPSSGHSDREKSESNTSETNGINFQSQHFDGESSDEDEFVKGLTLNENDKGKKNKVKDQLNNAGPGNLLSVGANLLDAIASSKPSSNDKESSDTDSFEIISEDDM